jgi:hypothetical protein
MAILAKQRYIGFSSAQAAVWIAAQDTNYNNLGIWGVSINALPAMGRAINQYAAVEGMRLCQQAGIDIRKKRIWQDRKKLLALVSKSSDGKRSGRDWLQGQMAKRK